MRQLPSMDEMFALEEISALFTAIQKTEEAVQVVLHDFKRGECSMCGRGRDDFEALIDAIHGLREQSAFRV